MRVLSFPFLATLVVCAFGALSPLQAASPALVVDVDTGRVIHAERATDPWFPASVTKLMTAYVALSEVRKGRLSLDTPLAVTPYASSMAPSKMGFKPGMEVTLDNALKMIMVKSANDVATTIAEGVGGSVENFADMMNREATRLGMRESYFSNPSGLPDMRQRTSARDLAILGRALMLEFPQHQDLFGIGAIKLGKIVMRNHNGLIGRYPGADGMKTGFICSSGFNVVASATRNGRRLIAVVLGSPNAGERTIKTAALLDKGFADFGWSGRSLAELPSSTLGTPPDMREVVCGRNRGRLPSEDDADVTMAAMATGGNSENAAGELTASTGLAAQGRQGRPNLDAVLGPRMALAPVPVFVGRRTTSSPSVASQNLNLPGNAQAFAPVRDGKPRPAPDSAPVALQKALSPKPLQASLQSQSSVEIVTPPVRPKLGAIKPKTQTSDASILEVPDAQVTPAPRQPAKAKQKTRQTRALSQVKAQPSSLTEQDMSQPE